MTSWRRWVRMRSASSGETKPTVLSLLADISSRVSKIEESVGIQQSASAAASGGKKYVGQSELARRQTMASAKYGIDIVLGAQWGDEGKGKLVDMLSQVRLWMENMIKNLEFSRKGRHKLSHVST